ncbi:hypothetical protein ACFWAR_14825 [Streptomyces sp. NPDC059917]|uniref:hypothetical protein n=1 Tax=Streptomyces sp. NPDC059917 TaxID=3347002 RepID=UPI003660C082
MRPTTGDTGATLSSTAGDVESARRVPVVLPQPVRLIGTPVRLVTDGWRAGHLPVTSRDHRIMGALVTRVDVEAPLVFRFDLDGPAWQFAVGAPTRRAVAPFHWRSPVADLTVPGVEASPAAPHVTPDQEPSAAATAATAATGQGAAPRLPLSGRLGQAWAASRAALRVRRVVGDAARTAGRQDPGDGPDPHRPQPVSASRPDRVGGAPDTPPSEPTPAHARATTSARPAPVRRPAPAPVPGPGTGTDPAPGTAHGEAAHTARPSRTAAGAQDPRTAPPVARRSARPAPATGAPTEHVPAELGATTGRYGTGAPRPAPAGAVSVPATGAPATPPPGPELSAARVSAQPEPSQREAAEPAAARVVPAVVPTGETRRTTRTADTVAADPVALPEAVLAPASAPVGRSATYSGVEEVSAETADRGHPQWLRSFRRLSLTGTAVRRRLRGTAHRAPEDTASPHAPTRATTGPSSVVGAQRDTGADTGTGAAPGGASDPMPVGDRAPRPGTVASQSRPPRTTTDGTAVARPGNAVAPVTASTTHSAVPEPTPDGGVDEAARSTPVSAASAEPERLSGAGTDLSTPVEDTTPARTSDRIPDDPAPQAALRMGTGVEADPRSPVPGPLVPRRAETRTEGAPAPSPRPAPPHAEIPGEAPRTTSPTTAPAPLRARTEAGPQPDRKPEPGTRTPEANGPLAADRPVTTNAPSTPEAGPGPDRAPEPRTAMASGPLAAEQPVAADAPSTPEAGPRPGRRPEPPTVTAEIEAAHGPTFAQRAVSPGAESMPDRAPEPRTPEANGPLAADRPVAADAPFTPEAGPRPGRRPEPPTVTAEIEAAHGLTFAQRAVSPGTVSTPYRAPEPRTAMADGPLAADRPVAADAPSTPEAGPGPDRAPEPPTATVSGPLAAEQPIAPGPTRRSGVADAPSGSEAVTKPVPHRSGDAPATAAAVTGITGTQAAQDRPSRTGSTATQAAQDRPSRTGVYDGRAPEHGTSGPDRAAAEEEPRARDSFGFRDLRTPLPAADVSPALLAATTPEGNTVVLGAAEPAEPAERSAPPAPHRRGATASLPAESTERTGAESGPAPSATPVRDAAFPAARGDAGAVPQHQAVTEAAPPTAPHRPVSVEGNASRGREGGATSRTEQARARGDEAPRARSAVTSDRPVHPGTAPDAVGHGAAGVPEGSTPAGHGTRDRASVEGDARGRSTGTATTTAPSAPSDQPEHPHRASHPAPQEKTEAKTEAEPDTAPRERSGTGAGTGPSAPSRPPGQRSRASSTPSTSTSTGTATGTATSEAVPLRFAATSAPTSTRTAPHGFRAHRPTGTTTVPAHVLRQDLPGHPTGTPVPVTGTAPAAFRVAPAPSARLRFPSAADEALPHSWALAPFDPAGLPEPPRPLPGAMAAPGAATRTAPVTRPTEHRGSARDLAPDPLTEAPDRAPVRPVTGTRGAAPPPQPPSRSADGRAVFEPISGPGPSWRPRSTGGQAVFRPIAPPVAQEPSYGAGGGPAGEPPAPVRAASSVVWGIPPGITDFNEEAK